MMSGALTLPDGRRGQALALGLTAAAAALLWLAVIAPLTGWYESRAAALAQQRQMAARMAALSQEIPALRAAVSAAGLPSAGNQVLLTGDTDAIAGANLQSALQDLAAQAGTSLDSAALLPAQQTGALRRIGMQVSVTATWPVLIALLEAVDTARPRMIIDGFSATSSSQPGTGQEPVVQANFSVSGFRAGAAP
jgi:general secretion pathway protein M